MLFLPLGTSAMIITYSSWIDRIPIVLLFGIATSVSLFHERLSRAASRCLYGAKFDIEHTNLILERVFQKAIAGSKAPLRLGPALFSSLIERQHDHVQSVQAFTSALKVVYVNIIDGV
jgi:origin recognition complex subunit 3